MVRIGVYATLIWSCFSVLGQVHHSCPLHAPGQLSYVNPLDEQWLSAYDVKYYSIELTASNTSTEISGATAIGVRAIRDMDTIVFELQDALSVAGVYVRDGIWDAGFTEQLSFDHSGDAIFIGLDRTRYEGEEFSIQIQYGGTAGQNRGFFAGISNARDPDYGFWVTYTLSEPHNAKDWFPVKQVLEDKIDSVKVKIHCNTQLSVASNGRLTDIHKADENRHSFTWITRYPIAYYLISFAVADYRDFSFNAALSETGDSVLVQNYIYDSEAVLDDWEEGILATGDMLTLFSRLFLDYPFADEKYGHAMAPMGGGMEHQTMTTIHDFGFSLVAHELAHQWFGDYITCGNWQDIWINEGFASYMEYVAYEHLVGKAAADNWMAQAMSLALGETSGSVFVPENRVDDTFRLFDFGLTYKKGAILLHMIRYWLENDELFYDILRTYLERYGNGLATGEDFRDILESGSGIDFSCFFEQWYYGEGYPRFTVYWAQESDSLKLRVEQTGSAASVTPFFQTPFDLEIRFYNETPRMVRLTQDEPVKDFSIAVNGVVNDILFDPANHILNSEHVIQQIPSERRFVFGPNPVSDELFIQFSNLSYIEEIRLTSLSGQEILRQENIENPAKMNLSALEDGTYLLMLFDKDNTYKEHIVKISN